MSVGLFVLDICREVQINVLSLIAPKYVFVGFAAETSCISMLERRFQNIVLNELNLAFLILLSPANHSSFVSIKQQIA